MRYAKELQYDESPGERTLMRSVLFLIPTLGGGGAEPVLVNIVIDIFLNAATPDGPHSLAGGA